MLMLSRSPKADELVSIHKFYQEQHEQFKKDDKSARKLLGLKKDETNDTISEWATWTALCRVILNTDEVITRS